MSDPATTLNTLNFGKGNDTMVGIEVYPTLKVNKSRLTDRQMQVILALERTGSQNLAARELGISTPVLNKYLRGAEKDCKILLATKSRKGTVLSSEGKDVVAAYRESFERLKKRNRTAIGCTLISENMVLGAMPDIEKEWNISMLVADDITNIFLLKSGLIDMAIFDDPLFTYENEEGYEVHELATDTLLHIRKGKSYLRFTYGAQRIGYRYLQSQNIEHRIVGFTRNMETLLNSKCSFFINESLAMREGLSLKNAAKPKQLEHRIMALKSPKVRPLESIVERMKVGKLK